MTVHDAQRAVEYCEQHGINGAVLQACRRELRRALAELRQFGLWDAAGAITE